VTTGPPLPPGQPPTVRPSHPCGRALRIGLFGYLGSGNIGNDASLESVLSYLRSAHPDAIVDAMCTGPSHLRAVYGIDAIPLFWYLGHEGRSHGAAAISTRLLGKVIDIVRTATWVRRHDAVIVPGMGVLETTLPLRALSAPYAFFLLCLSGRLLGTKVALVSVGANVISQRLIRWLYHSATRLASYVSYRDAGSLEAMPRRARDTATRRVYPDLVFGLPVKSAGQADPLSVGVGVMDFRGTNDDRGRQAQIAASYLEAVTSFVVWLTDNGRRVGLLIGDTKGCDDHAVEQVLRGVRERRPGLVPDQVRAMPVSSFGDLVDAMAPHATIVATRYHNLICALKLAKPTISICYAAKHNALMSDMGLAEFCQEAGELDLNRLIRQFTDVESQSAQLRPRIEERCEALAQQVAAQFSALSELLLPATSADVAVTGERAKLQHTR
jgi:polysaccharide pyruvyl transferase WcaK-like protein